MWCKFPPGVTEISISQQTFRGEIEDSEGGVYFRVPNHFGPTVRAVGGGFEVGVTPPEGAPEDLPMLDPVRDTAVSDAMARANALQAESDNLRRMLTQTTLERDEALSELNDAKARIAQLLAVDDTEPNSTTEAVSSKRSK